MAEIRFKEPNSGMIKFKESTAMLDSKMKTVGLRTKDDLNMYRQDEKDATAYAEETAGDYTAAIATAARKAAVGTMLKHKEWSFVHNDEPETSLELADDIKLIYTPETEVSWLNDHVSSVGSRYRRYDPFRGDTTPYSYGKGHAAKAEGNGGQFRSMISERKITMAEESADKVKIWRPIDIEKVRHGPYRTEHTGIMQTETFGTSGLVSDRMKERAIKQIRGGSGSRISPSLLPMSLKRFFGEKGRSYGKGDILRRFSERMRVNTSALSIAGAVTVMIIVITIMFTATFSMTGNEDGNDFAYDFYGFGTGDNAIVEVARAQIGNVGGDKFWRWYGFTSHVHWCACFVSWCADQCGYTKAGIIPAYAVCGDGANWFKTHHRWASRGYTPKSGDIIFYDYDSDGHMDHTGIVESCDGKTISTIEGNVSNVCRRQSHPVGSSMIAGFGVPVFRPSAGFENACAWAAQIAGDNSFHYVNWRSRDSMTHECPICHSHPAGNYRGWNCIGFAFACWKHGAGIRCRCSCSVINDPNWETLLHCSSDAEANRLATRLVGVPCTVIRNGGNTIPVSSLRKGDILAEFNGSTYFHTIFYEGNGKYADCTSGRSDNIRSGNPLSDSTKGKIKVAIRYIG